jgi:hypothetical protein
MPFSFPARAKTGNCPTPAITLAHAEQIQREIHQGTADRSGGELHQHRRRAAILTDSILWGTHAHISRRLKQLGIDTSHFKRVAPNRGKPSAWRLTPEHVLVVRSPGSTRPEARVLRRVLRECGVPYTCEACGIEGQWNGKPIVLHVDHINGTGWTTGRRTFVFSARTATRRLRHSLVDLQIRRGRSPIGQEAQALGA